MSKKDNKIPEWFTGYLIGIGLMTIVALYDQNQNLRSELVCARELSDHNFAWWRSLSDFVTEKDLAKEALEHYRAAGLRE